MATADTATDRHQVLRRYATRAAATVVVAAALCSMACGGSGKTPERLAPEALTVYVVDSQLSADKLAWGLAWVNRQRETLGSRPLNVDVTALSTLDEEAVFQAAYTELNSVRYGSGLPPVTVLDLRH